METNIYIYIYLRFSFGSVFSQSWSRSVTNGPGWENAPKRKHTQSAPGTNYNATP